MPRNPSGVYTIPNTFVDGTVINTDQVNANFADIATALTGSLPRGGEAAMTGALKLANGAEALPSLSFASDPDTGFFWTSSGEMKFASNGTTVATFTEEGLTLENPEELLQIGDFFDTARDLSEGNFLRRDGGLYDNSEFPDLAALLPDLNDGVIWENVPNGSSGAFQAIAQGPDRFVAIAESGANATITASVDGGPWEVVTTLSSFAPESIAYGGGVYVAVDGNGKYSQSVDGEVWSSPATLSGTAPGITAMTFGDGLFVLSGVLDSASAVWTSDDGASWTERLSGGFSATLWGVTYDNGIFLAFGTNGTLLQSDDGLDWTTRTTGVTSTLYGSAYADGTYVIVGEDGAVLTSSNGLGWTPRDSGTDLTLRAVAGNALGFVAVGDDGVARIAEADGLIWYGAATGVSSDLLDVIVDADDVSQYIVVGPPSYHLYGLRTTADQFRVPNDNPDYGWIKAL